MSFFPLNLVSIRIKLSILFFIFSIIAFLSFPEIDIYFSRLFYKNGLGFIYKNNFIVKFFYQSVYFLFWLIVIILLVIFIYNIFFPDKVFLNNKKLSYIFFCILIGPGLIVNYAFKDHLFGRARPDQIKEFKGEKEFSKVFYISKNCTNNCAFTSGHAAFAFFLTSFSYIFYKKRKLIWSLFIIYGFIISIVRIIQGSHFLSDVVFSGLLIIMINDFLHMLIFKNVRHV